MDDQITVRVPARLARKLRETSRRLGRRPSDVVRQALEAYLHAGSSARTRADSVSHLIGSLESGVPDLAERHRDYIIASLKRGR